MKMKASVNLNSTEWTDIVFEGKNKKYGAYELRARSSKWHWIALGIVLLTVIFVSFLPTLIQTVQEARKQNLGAIDGPVTIADITPIEERVPEENILREELAPPPPPLKSSIKFTPPVITSDEDVKDDEQMLSQEKLQESRVTISTATVEGEDDNPDAVFIDQLDMHKVIVAEKKDSTYTHVEQMPEFPGGDRALLRYLSTSIVYPRIAQENDIQGQVVVRFVVMPNGSVGEVEIVKGVDRTLDEEAIRVVKAMPKWTPGRQNGVAVRVYYVAPLQFKLEY